MDMSMYRTSILVISLFSQKSSIHPNERHTSDIYFHTLLDDDGVLFLVERTKLKSPFSVIKKHIKYNKYNKCALLVCTSFEKYTKSTISVILVQSTFANLQSYENILSNIYSFKF